MVVWDVDNGIEFRMSVSLRGLKQVTFKLDLGSRLLQIEEG
jgi:hypothetical protein